MAAGCGLQVSRCESRVTSYGLRVAGCGVTDCMLYIARHRIEFPIDSYQFSFAQNAQKIFLTSLKTLAIRTFTKINFRFNFLNLVGFGFIESMILFGSFEFRWFEFVSDFVFRFSDFRLTVYPGQASMSRFWIAKRDSSALLRRLSFFSKRARYVSTVLILIW